MHVVSQENYVVVRVEIHMLETNMDSKYLLSMGVRIFPYIHDACKTKSSLI